MYTKGNNQSSNKKHNKVEKVKRTNDHTEPTKHYKQLPDEITLKDGETIKIVGHSQGAAYAAGIASALAKHSKYGALIEFEDYLSPHQPGDIKHPSGVKGRQFSTKNDKVSSKGLIP